jgi:regulator of replication initiation timing
MDGELISCLEERIDSLLASYAALKQENVRLTEENVSLIDRREGVKARLDVILKKLEAV